MPLILAIEPDRRQASQLTAMVRGRLHAELVLGESAERALAALGQRVPDLILTSALLSPKDENALGERLRALDGAAAHVQTLTIPVLASSSGRGSNRASGVLSALRRDKGKAVPVSLDGCDPAVFAEQCKEYLERAESERIALAEKAAAAALDAQADAFVEPTPPPPSSSVVRPPSGRESKKHKAEHHQSIVLPKAAEPGESFRDVEPLAQPYQNRSYERADSYVASAPEPVATPVAPVVHEPAPEPAVKPKKQKSTKRGKTQPIKSVLGLPHDDNDGPASLLAAVAALEAEEQVEPIIATISETAQTFDAPPVASVNPVVTGTPIYEPVVRATPVYEPVVTTTPVYEPIATTTPVYEPLVSYTPPVEKSVIRPPAVEAPPAASEDLLDLSSLLDAPSRSAGSSSLHASSFSEDPVVDVYELDNSLLTTSFEEAVSSVEPVNDRLTSPAIVNDAPRAEGRSWPVLDTLIAETAALQAAHPSKPSSPAASSTAPVREEANPLSDILEALRRDAEQLPVASPPPASSPSSSIAAPEPAQTSSVSLSDIDVTSHDAIPADAGDDSDDSKKKKKAKASPAQDEWGFFDPDQCGFAALIEKLEEITDKDDTPTPRRRA